MSFLLFKVIFGLLFIALLVVAALIVRKLRRERQPAAAAVPQPRSPSGKPRLPNLRRKEEPAEFEGPPPVRRRQLRSISEFEAEETATPEQADFSAAVLARLEQAFEQLQAGEIALENYDAQVLAEHADVERELAARKAAGSDLGDVLAAQEAVRWCIDWSSEHRQQQSA